MSALTLQAAFLGLLWLLAGCAFAALLFRRRIGMAAGSPAAVKAAARQLRVERPATGDVAARSERLLLSSPEITIGRSESAALRLDDEFTSARHAVLKLTPGRLLLEDLGSTNGTLLNGSAVTQPVELKSGDIVRIGKTDIHVE